MVSYIVTLLDDFFYGEKVTYSKDQKELKGFPLFIGKLVVWLLSKGPGNNLEHLSEGESLNLEFFQKLIRLIQKCH